MTTGHPTFDHTVHDANRWLKAIAQELHIEERNHAYSALRATLHALRDRLPAEAAVHFSAQLPMVIRGLFFEGWRISGKPTSEHTIDAFCGHIAKELPASFPMDAATAARGVFKVIFNEIDPGEVAKVIDQVPVSLRSLWPAMARR
ncbi:conserved protein of unknown function [Pseudorhizobium banfieldiae]|uniref:DUF2267 domain-containing protein n=1 Tax=Pseudorhizobium banfieldiae TaxID=1125847 RepID=L0NKI6_9HYPH|nr:DUF2267 domain-containing protein [Pseudorhizobium banfieldiae]CAD6617588.1 hypothetical protein RNT25_03407 [arsenite-oxidising bacterium NT-25]CCF20807.1 conserved protein of unknown function [Pseudorhizobium banfieldiae]